jgi:hypothetical protein
VQEQEHDSQSTHESFEKGRRFYSQGNLCYLTKLASFQQGPARQNPAKNSCFPPFVNHDKLTGAAVDASAIASVEKKG